MNDNTVNDNAVNDNAVNVRRQIYMIFLRLRGDLRGPPLPVFLKDVPKHVRHLHVVFGRSIQSPFTVLAMIVAMIVISMIAFIDPVRLLAGLTFVYYS